MIAHGSSTRLIVSLAVVGISAMLLVSCSSGNRAFTNQDTTAAKGPQAHTVVIRGMKFQPQVLAVKAGDTVEWKNQDIVPHNAVSTETKEFDTGTMAVGGSWKHEALKKGTFFYTCTLHLNTKGKLVVE